MGSITGQLDTRAGSGSVTLSESSLPTGSIEVGEIGELSVEFDMRDLADRANKVFFAPAEFKVSFFDKVDEGSASGDSLLKLLDALNLSDVVTLELDFTTDDGHSFSETYEFTKKDVTYKREKREIEVESKISLDDDQTIQDVFNNHTSDIYDLKSQEGNIRNCMPARRFVENVMADSVGVKNHIDYTFTNNPFGSDPVPVIIGGGDYDDDGDGIAEIGYIDHDERISKTDATTILFRLGALTGSIIGSFFGYNFFVRRTYSVDSVSVTEDDTQELEIGLGKKAYRSVICIINSDQSTDNLENQWGRYMNWDYMIGDQDGLNDDAPKSLELYFYTLELRGALWDGTNNEYNAGDDYILANTNNQVVGTYQQGDQNIRLDNNSNPTLSRGDVIAFNINPSLGSDLELRNYLVGEVDGNRIYLENPLKTEVPDGTTVYYYDQTGSSFPFLTRAEPYAKAYGATGDNMIEVEFFDVDLFFPHQTFIPDSSFPDGVANNEYRPSNLTYDLINDVIEAEAYQIG